MRSTNHSGSLAPLVTPTTEAPCIPLPGSWQEYLRLLPQRRRYHVNRTLRDFERVLSAYYPTITNPNLRGVRRMVLRAASAWRYHLGFYQYPLELRPLQRLLAYQRPETCGF